MSYVSFNCIGCGKKRTLNPNWLKQQPQGRVDRIILLWRNPPALSRTGTHVAVNGGYSPSSVYGLMCKTCRAHLRQLCNQFIASQSSGFGPRRRRKASDQLPTLPRHTEREARRCRRAMPYSEFLKTDYWEKVRRTLFSQRGYLCERCNADGGCIVPHHVTYQHRGDELRHLDDLLLLCRPCHSAEHGIQDRENLIDLQPSESRR